jgi:hypothetical protein
MRQGFKPLSGCRASRPTQLNKTKINLSVIWCFGMRVLITGFEPNDDGLNASELVVVQ